MSNWQRGIALAAAVLPFIAASQIRAGMKVANGLIDAPVARGLAHGVCSFAEETPVTTDEGPIPISEVAVGDHVLAWDESIESTGYYTVTAVWSHEDPVVVELTIDGELIETTPEHPFLSSDGEWVAAGELAAGDEVVDADELAVGDDLRRADGSTGVVESSFRIEA